MGIIMIPPQKFREIVLQLLFSLEFEGQPVRLLEDLLMEQLAVSRSNVLRAKERALLVSTQYSAVDALIEKKAVDYDVGRIRLVELSILRLAVFEMLWDDAVPHRVAMAEAVRLTRKFASREAARFVNGVLDEIWRCQETAV